LRRYILTYEINNLLTGNEACHAHNIEKNHKSIGNITHVLKR